MQVVAVSRIITEINYCCRYVGGSEPRICQWHEGLLVLTCVGTCLLETSSIFRTEQTVSKKHPETIVFVFLIYCKLCGEMPIYSHR